MIVVTDTDLKPLVNAARSAHAQAVSEGAAKQAQALSNALELNDEKQNNLTSTTRSMIEQAPGVLNLANRVTDQIKDLQTTRNGAPARRSRKDHKLRAADGR